MLLWWLQISYDVWKSRLWPVSCFCPVDCVNQKVLPWRLLMKLSSNIMFVLIGRLLAFLTRVHICLWEGAWASAFLYPISFPGLPRLQFLITFSVQKWRGKTWKMSSCWWRQVEAIIDTRTLVACAVVHQTREVLGKDNPLMYYNVTSQIWQLLQHGMGS